MRYLLNGANTVFGNLMSMHDKDGKSLAFTDNTITDDPYWNACMANSTIGISAFLN